jgi:hypothetical protein
MPQVVENHCQLAIFIWRNEAPIVYRPWSRIRQANSRGGCVNCQHRPTSWTKDDVSCKDGAPDDRV